MLQKCYIMESKRSYEKESYKSKPTGIRFNLEQERIAFMRTKKKTRQQLVDYLLDNFVKGENPILAIQDLTQQTNVIKPITDAKPQTNVTHQVLPEKPMVSLFSSFMAELKAAKTIDQVKDIMGRAKGELFTPRDRMALEAFAKEVSSEMYSD